MASPDDLPQLTCSSEAEWESWLEAQHAKSAGVWLKLAKKASGVASVSNDEALDVALCFGWINGRRRSIDSVWYLQLYTPRRPRSNWSRVNVEKVAELQAAGRMRPAGLAEVERARADGRWENALERPSRLTVPDDLRRALDANPVARERFDRLGSSERYEILYALAGAKRSETRARRLAKFMARLEGS